VAECEARGAAFANDLFARAVSWLPPAKRGLHPAHDFLAAPTTLARPSGRGLGVAAGGVWQKDHGSARATGESA
jgi:hypothetical protein